MYERSTACSFLAAVPGGKQSSPALPGTRAQGVNLKKCLRFLNSHHVLPEHSVALKTLSPLPSRRPAPRPYPFHTFRDGPVRPPPWMPLNADIHEECTVFLEETPPVCERFHLCALLLPEGASLPRLETLLSSQVFWKQAV